MSGRATEVAERLIAKLFAGRRSGNVELHLSRDSIRDIAVATYDIGFSDGQKAKKAKKGGQTS